MKRSIVVSVLLTLAVLAVYSQVGGFDFLHIDDRVYVTLNEHVRNGLVPREVVWAFTTIRASNWHPLTWLSHMLDCELYGLDPAGHHWTNLLLHLFNALVLFGALRWMTGSHWPSALVAALFALHPLHAESVVWVAERKDLLSAAFGLLSIWAYARYARCGGAGRYGLTAALLALGLMAKPMLVTLPLLYLLLDYWPLGRWRPGRPDREEGPRSERPFLYLLAEKGPLLALSLASSIVTLYAQWGAIQTAAAVPFSSRLSNAVVSYVRYLGKTVWPVDLAPYYPHPGLPGGTPWAGWQILGAVLVLMILSIGALVARRRPYLIVGWLWYLGTLVPVLGLVQVGGQAMADRYTYLPLIGPFLALSWGLADLAAARGRGERLRRAVIAAFAVLAVAACGLLAHSQAAHWRDSDTLFSHTLELYPDNPAILLKLADERQAQGRTEEAAGLYRRALELRPGDAAAQMNFGVLLAREGRLDEALDHLREAVGLNPRSSSAHANLGNAFLEKGEPEKAIGSLERAARLAADSEPAIHHSLAAGYAAAGRLREAVQAERRALELALDAGDAEQARRYRLALDHYRRAGN